MKRVNSNSVSLAETVAALRVAALTPLTQLAALVFMMVDAVESEYAQ